ncbi:hypothetical protein CMUS01_10386 [Colletotrichum musicola]|uniref:Rhodopsin domain-containing protein n=1 Tax=Colletotrichum musicola TaxID=2175873 RepID=A0A8H6N9A0_9PEZI|nr:hypothetical protein CMUS01_10386 [Colletotrichum musicola]
MLGRRGYIAEDTSNTHVSFFNFVTFQLLYVFVPMMTVMDLTTVILRVASIRQRRSKFYAADYAAVVATEKALKTYNVILVGVIIGVTGRHDWDPWPPPDGPWPKSDYTLATKDTDQPRFHKLYAKHAQVNYILNCLQGVSIGVVRLAFLFLFRKLFRLQGRWYIFSVNTLIVAVTFFMLIYTGTTVFSCGVHPQARWINHETKVQYCFKSVEYNFIANFLTVILDASVFLIPMYPLYKITKTMVKQRRNYILIVFFLGFLSVVSSIFNLVLATPFFLYEDDYIHTWLRNHGAGDGDTFGWAATTNFWSYMELSVGAAVCNLPIISRFVVQRWLKRWWYGSKQATIATVAQVQKAAGRIVSGEGAQEGTPPRNDAIDTLPICLARTMTENTEIASCNKLGHDVMSEIGEEELVRPRTR